MELWSVKTVEKRVEFKIVGMKCVLYHKLGPKRTLNHFRLEWLIALSFSQQLLWSKQSKPTQSMKHPRYKGTFFLSTNFIHKFCIPTVGVIVHYMNKNLSKYKHSQLFLLYIKRLLFDKGRSKHSRLLHLFLLKDGPVYHLSINYWTT